MLSRLSVNHRFNGAGGIPIFFKSVYRYSYCTAIQTAQSPNAALVDFLVQSLGFSKETAVRSSNKVSRAKPFDDKPEKVVNYLENLGVSKTQIRKIVSADPRLLFYDVDKTLEPKVSFFRELGFSGSDLGRFISVGSLTLGLDSCIKPRIDYFRKLLGGDEKVALALKRCYFLLSFDPEMVEKNILLLRNFGITDKNIGGLITWNSTPFLGTTTQSLLERLLRVENDLGIPRHSPVFVQGVKLLSSCSQSNMEAKFRFLRCYGFSDEAIFKIIRLYPNCLSLSIDRWKRALDYFIKELGYDTEYLASHPKLIAYDLERRVKPRNEVLKILNERKSKRCALCSALHISELKFLKDFVLPYKDQLPNMHEAYIKKVKKQEIEECLNI
ncbi:OLC1v1005696C1 [Oldenlandia corymbosa var. corymbosa]|uniref:OLC1v1005696C1 n=1 Tax=Oldenlandia corymbosa var. corymbosa TaxID=529605 RepID=A0AAV1DGG9_OLDCO|nr:OLC1v1005696C1 [Oldenlandia corymbosa var. corymbosa]